jgi:hypothetical protein
MSRTDIPVLTQHALNCYRSGVAVIISGSDGSPLHGLETFTYKPLLAAEGSQGLHLCVSFPDVDRAAFQRANVSGVLEEARLKYLEHWKQRQQTLESK